jgi:hypothetical protein
MPCQVGGLGPPCLRLLPPFVFVQVASAQCPSLGKEQVALLCPTLTQKPCIQQYPVGSQAGLVALQWGGFAQPDCCFVGGLLAFNFAMASVRLAMIFVCCWFIATILLIVLFFWMDAFAKLSSNAAIFLPGQFPVQLPDWQRLSRQRSCG